MIHNGILRPLTGISVRSSSEIEREIHKMYRPLNSLPLMHYQSIGKDIFPPSEVSDVEANAIKGLLFKGLSLTKDQREFYPPERVLRKLGKAKPIHMSIRYSDAYSLASKLGYCTNLSKENIACRICIRLHRDCPGGAFECSEDSIRELTDEERNTVLIPGTENRGVLRAPRMVEPSKSDLFTLFL
jgi:hypothetical protein